MSQTIRVIVLNTDEEVSPDLRMALLAQDGVKIVAEIDEPAMLGQVLDQFPAEVLLVHLDPNPVGMMDIVAPLIEPRKDELAAIGMTEDRDAELVMRAMRAGMKEFLWKPFPPEDLAEILQRVSKTISANPRKLGRLITAVGVCGGVGTTTVAANLAVELANLGNWSGARAPGVRPRTAVVDLDLHIGQVAMHLDAQPTYTIAELCESAEQLDPQQIERAMFKHETGVHLLARPTDHHHAESISAGQCAGALAALQEHYDFIVADLSARFDNTAKAVFDMSDVLLIVVQLVVPAVRNADRLLSDMQRGGYPMDRVKIVCNRFGRESGYLEQADVEATLKRKLDFLLPDDWKTCSMAVNMGSPLFNDAPKSRVRGAINEMAQTLAGVETDADAPASNGHEPKKRLFGVF